MTDRKDGWKETMRQHKAQIEEIEELLTQERYEEAMFLCDPAENSIARLRHFAYRHVE